MNSTKSKTLFAATTILIVAVVVFLSHSALKSESAQGIQTRPEAKQLVEAPVLAPVSVFNNVKSNSSSGQDTQAAAVLGTRHFTLSVALEAGILDSKQSPEGVEGSLKSMLIARGVTFPVGAKLAYAAGEVYLTDTPANLDQAEVAFAKVYQEMKVPQLETRDFVLSRATQDRMLNNPEQDIAALEELIKSMLIAGGVDFPTGAKLAYVAGKVYLTNTPANLDQAGVVFAQNK